MSRLSSCSRSFAATTRSKGEQYFRGERVWLEDMGDNVIVAQVRGSGGAWYDVRLDVAAPREGLYVACTCPHFAEGNLCKHIWATMLEADQEGLLRRFQGTATNVIPDEELLNEPADLYDDDEFGFDDGVETNPLAASFVRKLIERSGGPLRSTRSTNKKGPKKARDWFLALQKVPAALGDTPVRFLEKTARRDQRIYYRLDVSASVAANAVVIELMQQETRKDGSWGKVKSLKIHGGQLDHISLDEDRWLLGMLLGNRLGSSHYYGGYGWAVPGIDISRVTLSPTSHELLPRLCATGRFEWMLSMDVADDARPITWDDGPAWRFRLRVVPHQKQWKVTGELYRGEQAVLVSEPVLVVNSSLVLFSDRMARIEVAGGHRWLLLLRSEAELFIPQNDRTRFLEALWSDAAPPEVIWPDNLQPDVAPATPQGCLRVHKQKPPERWGYQPPRDLVFADVQFDYDGQQLKLDDPRGGLLDKSANRVLQRDPAREAELLRQLVDLRVQPNKSSRYGQRGDVQLPIKRLDDIITQLVERGWQVEAEGARIRTPGNFHFRVQTSGVDWFELESEIDFGEVTATLPELLAAVRNGENYVKLGDGSRGMLPSQWLQRFAPIADLAESHDGKLRFKPAQSLLLDALLSEKNEQIQVQLDRQFTRFRKKLQKFSGVKPRPAPRGFRGQLRPYQQGGLGWLNFLEEFGLGGCLADDMGLGKTVQVLAWLLARRQRRGANRQAKPTLIVVPKSLVFNWIEEAERFVPKLRVVNYTGIDRSERAADFDGYDIVLTTYGTMRRDIDKLKDQPFDCAILDEAQAIKNDASQTAKACRLLSADLRLALTGTPVENHLGELWSLFEFLNPGMLGRSTTFRTYCQQADDQPQTHELLRRGLAPFILRRTKQQVLTDLPDKTEQTIHCVLSPAERKKYNHLRDYYRASLKERIADSGMNKAKMHVLEALLRLRQAACHPGLLDEKLAAKSSAKLDALLDQLREVIDEGHKALVFSQFTSLLSIVRRQLDGQKLLYEYLDGRTRKRMEKVHRFQTDPACPLFLISLKAGGHGLNLTAADYVFLLDPWWNPAVEAQAIDRTHRIGQTRHVFAYRLIAAETVEEKILELQEQKRDLADAIISSNTNLLAKLTADDLQVLLS